MKIQNPLSSACFALFLSTAILFAGPEAFEIGPPDKNNPPAHGIDDLPGGKEADGIIGDFVLRNDKVEAVISHNAYLRRANMSTFYGDDGITPGCLYDLTLRGADNDQITAFTPSAQQGGVAFVRIARDGSDGEAVVETVVTAAMNKGLSKRHEYRLRDGWQGVLIVTTYRNEGTKPAKGTVRDRWTKFTTMKDFKGINWADAVDPADKAGYAYDWVKQEGTIVPGREVTVKPGEEISFARFLAVGRSPGEAVGVVTAFQGGTAEVTGEIVDEKQHGIGTARLELKFGSEMVPVYPDSQGKFSLRLPQGEYPWKLTDHGRADVAGTLTVGAANAKASLKTAMGPQSAIAFDIKDGKGRSIPCKAQFNGIEGTKSPNLGPTDRAHGCADQYHSEGGSFRVALDPGKYEIIVTHGVEFGHLRQKVDLQPGKTVKVSGVLKRLVDTTGWISADYHNHSTPSGDNTCGTDDRIINLAAENIEFAPTTEHNRLYDWTPHIEKLGLTGELNTVPGMEMTGRMAHMNMFPQTPVPYTQDWGAPVYEMEPRVNALNLRRFQGENPDRWIHINHPDMVQNFTDRDGDGRLDGGFQGLETMIDGIETQNYRDSRILEDFPYYTYRRGTREYVGYNREFQWLQNLNRGHRYWGIAVCDAHRVYGNGVGGWRTYVKSSTDNPAELKWDELSRNSKAGRMILSTGPFLEVETEDGIIAGGATRGNGGTRLKIRVQCTDWIDIDRVQILVNGRQRPDLNFTRESHPKWFGDGVVKFDRTVDVPLSEDAHLIVVAWGENFDLKTGYGTSTQASMHPCAYNNPIFIDVDGHGFKPSGDLLDFPLPTKGIKPEDVKAMLEERKASGG